MREIKFRAFLHEEGNPLVEGHMIYSEPFPIQFWEIVGNYPLTADLMQYTGLKDKNGKEIYEGDIIEIEIFEFKKRDIRVIFTVEFVDSCFIVKIVPQKLAHNALLVNALPCMVIGNVHENPELLETE